MLTVYWWEKESCTSIYIVSDYITNFPHKEWKLQKVQRYSWQQMWSLYNNIMQVQLDISTYSVLLSIHERPKVGPYEGSMSQVLVAGTCSSDKFAFCTHKETCSNMSHKVQQVELSGTCPGEYLCRGNAAPCVYLQLVPTTNFIINQSKSK